jgi:hypothetical protein
MSDKTETVEDVLARELVELDRKLAGSAGPVREQLEAARDAKARQLETHRSRASRPGVVEGDPYHRTREEIDAESGRLG